MRIVFLLLLLLANLAAFAYSRFDLGNTGEAARLTQQVRPDMIKLLTPQQVAALGPTKPVALADVCLEWGPISDADRARVMNELEPLGLGRLLSQKRTETATAYWLYVPPFANKAAADKRAAELTAAGLKNVSVVDNAPQRFAISLGAFRSEEAANAYRQRLEPALVADAKVGPRQQVLAQTVFVVHDPEDAVVARLKGLKSSYPDAEEKTGPCDKTG